MDSAERAEKDDRIENNPTLVRGIFITQMLLLIQEDNSLLVRRSRLIASATISFGLHPLRPKFVPVTSALTLPVVGMAATTGTPTSPAEEKENSCVTLLETP
jgi:hypothetical protein